MAIKAQYNKEDKVKKQSHFHEKKPTISENVNFAGGHRILYKSEDIYYYHQKKELEKRSDIDVESTDFTITLKT